jgi:hypothetical protein
VFGIAIGSYAVIDAPCFWSCFINSIDRASLMSSVFGLKARPSIAIFFTF